MLIHHRTGGTWNLVGVTATSFTLGSSCRVGEARPFLSIQA